MEPDFNFRDYLEFINGITLFRSMRDTDQFPETWLEREVSMIKVGSWSDEHKQELLFIAKFADLIDDRKLSLLKEIEEDVYRVQVPGCIHTEIEITDSGLGRDWWLSLDAVDDAEVRVGVIYDSEMRKSWVSGNIKAADKETADRILRERVEGFLAELPAAA